MGDVSAYIITRVSVSSFTEDECRSQSVFRAWLVHTLAHNYFNVGPCKQELEARRCIHLPCDWLLYGSSLARM
jgi:hypothetical protein